PLSWLLFRPSRRLLRRSVPGAACFRALRKQRLAEKELPVRLDLRAIVCTREKQLAISEEQLSDPLPVQRTRHDSEIVLVFLLAARQLAHEDVVLIDQVDAESAEGSQIMSSVGPVRRQVVRLHMPNREPVLCLDLFQ